MNHHGLQTLQRALVGDQNETLLNQMQRFQSSFLQQQEQLIQSVNVLANNSAQNKPEDLSQTLIEALREVIKDFNTKIHEQFGDNFKELNQAVGQLVVWQENYRLEMSSLQQQFALCLEGIQQTKEALSQITAESQTIAATVSKLQEALKSFEGMQTTMANQFEALSALSKEAKDFMPALHTHMKDIGQNFTQTIEHNMGQQKVLMEKQLFTLDQIFRGFQTIDSANMSDSDLVLMAWKSRYLNQLEKPWDKGSGGGKSKLQIKKT
jgi:chromosome segregation ATPase